MIKTTQHSSYWLDDDLFDTAPDEPKTDLQRITRLSAVRRGIANFVSILSGKNVPVHFSSGKESYTDGQQVIISADEDSEKFDVMVGLALHEGSHILLSDFSLLHTLKRSVENPLRSAVRHGHWNTNTAVVRAESGNVFTNILHPDIVKLLPDYPQYINGGGFLDAESPYWKASLQVLDDLRFLMNILEDRRIDNYVYKNAMGYRPYYQALYDRYFCTKEMGRNLRFNPKFRELTVENYIIRLLYCIHPAADFDAMPGLRALINRMDLNTIDRVSPKYDKQIMHDVFGDSGLTNQTVPRPAWLTEPKYESMPVLWKEANVLYAHILKYVGMVTYEPTKEPSQNPMNDIAQQKSSALDGLPNLDGAPEASDMVPVPVEKDTKGKGKKQVEVDGKFNEKTAKKELETAKKVLEGDIKKKKLSKADADAVNALEAADAKMVDITGEGVPFGKCMVTRKISDELLGQDWFIFKQYGWERALNNDKSEACIAAGKRMGQILVHRLQVRNDPMITKQTRLPHGGLDRRLLAQLGMDITSVFQKSRIDIHKPAMLHLTLDASGSMSGRKWDKVRSVAVALAYVGSKLRNVDTVVSIRGGGDMPIVSVVYDSRRDQFSRFLKYMRVLAPAGATPEGLCFKATMDLIKECADTHDVYFINFSDGEPSFGYSETKGKKKRFYGGAYFSYTGDTATNHTKMMVQQMRDSGIKVLSYFISDGTYAPAYATFKKMYGEDSVSVNVQNATEVLRTLNSRLLVRG